MIKNIAYIAIASATLVGCKSESGGSAITGKAVQLPASLSKLKFGITEEEAKKIVPAAFAKGTGYSGFDVGSAKARLDFSDGKLDGISFRMKGKDVVAELTKAWGAPTDVERYKMWYNPANGLRARVNTDSKLKDDFEIEPFMPNEQLFGKSIGEFGGRAIIGQDPDEIAKAFGETKKDNRFSIQLPPVATEPFSTNLFVGYTGKVINEISFSSEKLKEAVIKAWGEPTKIQAGTDERLFWVDEAKGLRAELDAKSDTHRLEINTYIPITQLAGKEGKVFAFETTAILGAKAADLAAAYPQFEIENDTIDLGAVAFSQYGVSLRMSVKDGIVTGYALSLDTFGQQAAFLDAFKAGWGEPKEVEQYGSKYLQYANGIELSVREDQVWIHAGDRRYVK